MQRSAPADCGLDGRRPVAANSVWDQRGWHRRGEFVPRGPDDMRVLSIFGFHQTQMWSEKAGDFEGILYTPTPMPPSLARQWVLASAAGEADADTFLGGRWTPASVWRMVEEMRRSDPRVQAMLDEVAGPRL